MNNRDKLIQELALRIFNKRVSRADVLVEADTASQENNNLIDVKTFNSEYINNFIGTDTGVYYTRDKLLSSLSDVADISTLINTTLATLQQQPDVTKTSLFVDNAKYTTTASGSVALPVSPVLFRTTKDKNGDSQVESYPYDSFAGRDNALRQLNKDLNVPLPSIVSASSTAIKLGTTIYGDLSIHVGANKSCKVSDNTFDTILARYEQYADAVGNTHIRFSKGKTSTTRRYSAYKYELTPSASEYIDAQFTGLTVSQAKLRLKEIFSASTSSPVHEYGGKTATYYLKEELPKVKSITEVKDLAGLMFATAYDPVLAAASLVIARSALQEYEAELAANAQRAAGAQVDKNKLAKDAQTSNYGMMKPEYLPGSEDDNTDNKEFTDELYKRATNRQAQELLSKATSRKLAELYITQYNTLKEQLRNGDIYYDVSGNIYDTTTGKVLSATTETEQPAPEETAQQSTVTKPDNAFVQQVPATGALGSLVNTQSPPDQQVPATDTENSDTADTSSSEENDDGFLYTPYESIFVDPSERSDDFIEALYTNIYNAIVEADDPLRKVSDGTITPRQKPTRATKKYSTPTAVVNLIKQRLTVVEIEQGLTKRLSKLTVSNGEQQIRVSIDNANNLAVDLETIAIIIAGCLPDGSILDANEISDTTKLNNALKDYSLKIQYTYTATADLDLTTVEETVVKELVKRISNALVQLVYYVHVLLASTTPPVARIVPKADYVNVDNLKITVSSSKQTNDETNK